MFSDEIPKQLTVLYDMIDTDMKKIIYNNHIEDLPKGFILVTHESVDLSEDAVIFCKDNNIDLWRHFYPIVKGHPPKVVGLKPDRNIYLYMEEAK